MSVKFIKTWAIGLMFLATSSMQARIILVHGHEGTQCLEIVKALAERMPGAKVHTTDLYKWSNIIAYAHGEGIIENGVDLDQGGRVLLEDDAFLAARERLTRLDKSQKAAADEYYRTLTLEPWLQSIEHDAEDTDTIIVGATISTPKFFQLFCERLSDVDDILIVQAYSGLDVMKEHLSALRRGPYRADYCRMIDVFDGYLQLYCLQDDVPPCMAEEDPIDNISSATFREVLDIIDRDRSKDLRHDELNERVEAWISGGDRLRFYQKHKVDFLYRFSETTPAGAADEVAEFVQAGRGARAAKFNLANGLWG